MRGQGAVAAFAVAPLAAPVGPVAQPAAPWLYSASGMGPLASGSGGTSGAAPPGPPSSSIAAACVPGTAIPVPGAWSQQQPQPSLTQRLPPSVVTGTAVSSARSSRGQAQQLVAGRGFGAATTAPQVPTATHSSAAAAPLAPVGSPQRAVRDPMPASQLWPPTPEGSLTFTVQPQVSQVSSLTTQRSRTSLEIPVAPQLAAQQMRHTLPQRSSNQVTALTARMSGTRGSTPVPVISRGSPGSRPSSLTSRRGRSHSPGSGGIRGRTAVAPAGVRREFVPVVVSSTPGNTQAIHAMKDVLLRATQRKGLNEEETRCVMQALEDIATLALDQDACQRDHYTQALEVEFASALEKSLAGPTIVRAPHPRLDLQRVGLAGLQPPGARDDSFNSDSPRRPLDEEEDSSEPPAARAAAVVAAATVAAKAAAAAARAASVAAGAPRRSPEEGGRRRVAASSADANRSGGAPASPARRRHHVQSEEVVRDGGVNDAAKAAAEAASAAAIERHLLRLQKARERNKPPKALPKAPPRSSRSTLPARLVPGQIQGPQGKEPGGSPRAQAREGLTTARSNNSAGTQDDTTAGRSRTKSTSPPRHGNAAPPTPTMGRDGRGPKNSRLAGDVLTRCRSSGNSGNGLVEPSDGFLDQRELGGFSVEADTSDHIFLPANTLQEEFPSTLPEAVAEAEEEAAAATPNQATRPVEGLEDAYATAAAAVAADPAPATAARRRRSPDDLIEQAREALAAAEAAALARRARSASTGVAMARARNQLHGAAEASPERGGGMSGPGGHTGSSSSLRGTEADDAQWPALANATRRGGGASLETAALPS